MATKTQSSTTSPNKLPPIQNRAAALNRLKLGAVTTSNPVEKVKTLATRSSPSQTLQTSVSKPSTTKKPAGHNASEYGRCESCKREIKKTTLATNGGKFCGNCKRSKDGTGKPNKRRTSKECEGCNQSYSLATLTKYKFEGKETNRCKKCHDKFVSEQTGSSSSTSGLSACTSCEKPTSNCKDLSGFCIPCTVVLMQVYFLDNLAQVIQSAIETGEVQSPSDVPLEGEVTGPEAVDAQEAGDEDQVTSD